MYKLFFAKQKKYWINYTKKRIIYKNWFSL